MCFDYCWLFRPWVDCMLWLCFCRWQWTLSIMGQKKPSKCSTSQITSPEINGIRPLCWHHAHFCILILGPRHFNRVRTGMALTHFTSQPCLNLKRRTKLRGTVLYFLRQTWKKSVKRDGPYTLRRCQRIAKKKPLSGMVLTHFAAVNFD